MREQTDPKKGFRRKTLEKNEEREATYKMDYVEDDLGKMGIKRQRSRTADREWRGI
jgi:hypothetical protein